MHQVLAQEFSKIDERSIENSDLPPDLISWLKFKLKNKMQLMPEVVQFQQLQRPAQLKIQGESSDSDSFATDDDMGSEGKIDPGDLAISEISQIQIEEEL